jgi:hypothetical protein
LRRGAENTARSLAPFGYVSNWEQGGLGDTYQPHRWKHTQTTLSCLLSQPLVTNILVAASRGWLESDASTTSRAPCSLLLSSLLVLSSKTKQMMVLLAKPYLSRLVPYEFPLIPGHYKVGASFVQ